MLSLSVVIPTYNESENIAVLLEHLINHLSSIKDAYEIIVVDDASPDGTAAVVEQFISDDKNIRLIKRIEQRDLSAALAMGLNSATGKYLLIMDADFQHDPALVVRMLALIESSNVDLVVATRYAMDGGTSNWSGMRCVLSRFATRLTAFVLRTTISDPLSGYFILRRDLWMNIQSQLRLSGFKILLEIISATPHIRSAEIGYQFVARARGRSKLGVTAGLEFILALPRLFLNVRTKRWRSSE